MWGERMEDKLLILLKNLKINEQVHNLNEGKITKVVVGKDDSYTFHLSFKQLIPFAEYQLLLQGRENFPYPVKYQINYEETNFNVEELLPYVGYLLEKLKLDYPVCSTLTVDNFKIGSIIKIETCNEIQLEQLSQLRLQIEGLFNSVGINKTIDFYIDENNDVFKDIKEEMEAYEPVEIDMSLLQKPEKAPVQENNYKNNYRSKGTAIDMKIEEITNQTMENNIIIKGYVFKTEMIKTRAGKHIQSLWVTDYTDSIIVKRFENNSNNSLEELKVIGKGNIWIKVRGEARFDSFAHETVLMAREIEVIKSPAPRKDTCEAKRVELHTHSKMSAMDGIGTISQYINAVASWGHKAIAVTDHGNVQSFPEAQMASGKAGVKMIYGVEFNMVDPVLNIVYNPIDTSIEHATYVSFDLETTGLSVIHDGITEFGAVKIRNGEVIDRMQRFINPGKTISSRITNLTSITNDMVKNEPTIDVVLPEIMEFFGDCILVAHNANFDVGFLNENLKRNNLPEINNPVIDSLALARAILKPMKSYRLGNVCRTYRVNYDDEVAHRADYDAQVLGEVFNLMIHQIMQTGKYSLLDLCELTGDDI